MSTLTLEAERARGLTARLRDYLELTKPKIAVLELVAVIVAALAASYGSPDVGLLFAALAGTAMLAAGASAWNQWIERDTDALMLRTAGRPLPGGRLSSAEVMVFGTVATLAGVLCLALAVNAVTAALGLASWVLYVCVYTPLKRRSPFNTTVGAVAGALPVLMGWTAVGGRLDLAAATLFGILFLWQFPHFMAIAWMYRREYGAAGLQMLPVVDPTGRRTAVQAVVAALLLLPVSLLPAVVSFAGGAYFAWALALGGGQLACAVWFALRLDETSARWLLRASLVYLPALLTSLVAGPFFT